MFNIKKKKKKLKKSEYITVNSYGAHCVKNIKHNVICPIKLQIKDAVAYLLFH